MKATNVFKLALRVKEGEDIPVERIATVVKYLLTRDDLIDVVEITYEGTIKADKTTITLNGVAI